MSVAVTVLGSSGMWQTPERAASGYLVELDDDLVWIDAGGGTWRNLVSRIEHRRLGAVILTHRHPDHVIDIFQAFHARQYGWSGPLDPIPLWAPEETIDRLRGFSPDIAKTFDVRSVSGGDSFDFASARFSFVEMAHPVDTVGVRVERSGAVLAYSADTGPAADFRSLAGDADLFLCEATFQDNDEEWEGHMSAAQAARAAADVGARRLVLTHLPPGRDVSVSLAQARAAVNGSTIDVAEDGIRLEVAP